VSQAPHHLSPPSTLSSTSVLLLNLSIRPPKPSPWFTPFSAHILSKAVVSEMVGSVKDLGLGPRQGRLAVECGREVSRGWEDICAGSSDLSGISSVLGGISLFSELALELKSDEASLKPISPNWTLWTSDPLFCLSALVPCWIDCPIGKVCGSDGVVCPEPVRESELSWSWVKTQLRVLCTFTWAIKT